MKLILESLLDRGFTIFELVMTIIVVSIIAVPVSLLLSQHISSVVQSEDYLMASNLGRFEMEKVDNIPYDSIAVAVSSFPNYEGYNYDVLRTVTYVFGTGASQESLKKIIVAVTKSGRPDVLVSLTTYLARGVSYGL